jgi:hypothetical protein
VKRARPRRAGRRLLIGGAAMLVLGGVAAAVAIGQVGVTPRVLGPYIEHRTSGHNPAIVAAGRFVGRTLLALDRGPPPEGADTAPPLTLGAQAQPVDPHAAAGIMVGSADELRAAMAAAEAGTVITLLPGVYRFEGMKLDANRPGRAGAPITVRAVQPGSVRLEFGMVEGFKVSAPWWRFENLAIRGACGDDDSCEHAFHVVGAASHFAAVNNTISDFNAHFKINTEDGRFPDDGLIESNTLDNGHPRATRRPVTPIDLVAASRWTIRANLISDFIKLDGDRVSYGAFAKGAGSANLFERNLVWCERRLRGQPGQRVGLSLGGGGTGKEACRDGKCITEQDGGILRANLIAGCSDAGIYLNNAAASRVEDNTVVDTGGIDVRFAGSSATLDGNLVDGAIRSRDGGLLHLGDNLDAPLWQSFTGYHPLRRLFADPVNGDFAWRAGPPARSGAATRATPWIGLCGRARTAAPAYGAFDSFTPCVVGATPPPA